MGFIFFESAFLHRARAWWCVKLSGHNTGKKPWNDTLIGPFSPRFIFSSQRCGLRGTVRANIRKKYHLGKLSLLDNTPN